MPYPRGRERVRDFHLGATCETPLQELQARAQQLASQHLLVITVEARISSTTVPLTIR